MPLPVLILSCPADAGSSVHRRLLGLAAGERLLLALQHAGVERAWIAGAGVRPVSSRSALQPVDAPAQAPAEAANGFLVIPADLTFDRRLLADPTRLGADLPIRLLPGSAWDDAVSNPAGLLAELGVGRAGDGHDFAIRAIDRASAKLAIRSLLLSLRKPADGFISRHLNRHISLFVTRFIVDTGIRPNHLTAFIMLFGVAAAVLAAVAEPWWTLVLAGLFFQTQSVLDGCDGEIARLTFRFSKLGQWLDTIGDDATNFLFCLGLTIGQARLMHSVPVLALGLATFATQCGISFVFYRRLMRMGTGDLLAYPYLLGEAAGTGPSGRILAAARAAGRRDFYVFVIALVTAFQLPLAGLVMFAAGTFPTAIGVYVNEKRIVRAERLAQSSSSQ
ncbi:MAG: CDP-alcohol phosphatidyltransferase family protein [Deltaproteobacteria bacterium]|nr:CDP-alcohol phosphatidyltransferase family protein [Deltaproteobacteria bacterium]